jgi:predicted nucleic acid-binding protein
MKVLVDANIFLAVVMEEPEKTSIINATSDAELISPEVLPYEIGNALSAMVKRNSVKPNLISQLFSVYSSIPVRLVSVDIEKALQIAIEYKIYAYDAYFLECAKRLRIPIFSLDTKLNQVADDLSISKVNLS